MRWQRWILPVLPLAVALVLILRFSAAEGSYRIYVPTGYVSEVNRLIAEGKLVYDCPRDRIELRGLTPGEEYFYRNSYLRRDRLAWNEGGDRRPFVAEREESAGAACRGRLLAANDSYHKQRLPTYVADTWRGSLYLRQSVATTTLTSPERTLEVVPPPWELLPLPAQAFEDVWFGRNTGGIRSQQLAFKMLDRGRAFATLKTIGRRTALEVTGERPEVALNGCPLPLGWRVRLDEGDTVRARMGGRLDERYSVETGSRAGLLSFVRSVNGEPRRKTFTDRLPMARDVAWAIDAAILAGRKEDPGSRDFDVYLTLDPFLGEVLDGGLEAFCRERYGRRPLRAAITLLDPASGRLLALASYPSASDLDELDLGASTARRQLLRRNHNFLLHPAGSAAKPFLASAALAVRPALASLRIPCWPGGDPPKALLGYELGVYNLPADCAGSGAGKVDFDSYLAVSSNRYMLYLGLLAMADWRGTRAPTAAPGGAELPALDRYVLGGRSFSVEPRLPIFKGEAGGATELKDVAEEELFRWFRDLFDVRVHYRRGSTVDHLDLSYWEPVLAATLGDTSHLAAMSFSEIAPERVNLRANLIQQLRQDLYTLLLGTGNNRWSNVQLAQAMARVLTGRPVRARLVDRVVIPGGAGGTEDGGGEAAEPDEAAAPAEEVLWDLEAKLVREAEEGWAGWSEERVRRGRDAFVRVRDAMKGVVERPDGTARDLRSVLAEINRKAPPGVRYSALGKTGTPTSALATVRRSPTRPAPEAVVVYSGNEQVQSGVLLLALRREKDGETSELVLTFYVEGQGGGAEAVDLAAGVLAPLVESYWPEDWLESR